MRCDRRQALLALAQLAVAGWPALGRATAPCGGAPDGALWAAYAQALAAQMGLCNRDDTFKIGSGLSLADWEVVNYTGLPETDTPGTKLWENAYGWGDAMPRYASPCYVPGNSFHDMYAALLGALHATGADQAAVDVARTRLKRDRMGDRNGTTWPAYRITPGLNDFMVASLQSMVSHPPQIQFTMCLPAALDGGNFCSGIAHTRSVRVEFQAQAAQMFRVQPGRWYDPAMVRLFADRLEPASALANKPLFGPDGFLNLRTSQILVALGRSVTIHLNADDLQRCPVAAVSQASTTFRIGGFCFDSALTDICGGAGTLTFRDNTSAPYVIGVTVDKL
jgi:hypothetical protein